MSEQRAVYGAAAADGVGEPDGAARGERWYLGRVRTQADQPLLGDERIADVSFVAGCEHSRFVWLTLTNLSASKAGGEAIPKIVSRAGRVAVVAYDPMLETVLTTNRDVQLLLYGVPEVAHEVQFSTDVAAPAPWPVLTNVTLTNLVQEVQRFAPTNTPFLFFRAERPE